MFLMDRGCNRSVILRSGLDMPIAVRRCLRAVSLAANSLAISFECGCCRCRHMLRNGLDMLDALPDRQRDSLIAAASFISDVSPQLLGRLPVLWPTLERWSLRSCTLPILPALPPAVGDQHLVSCRSPPASAAACQESERVLFMCRT